MSAAANYILSVDAMVSMATALGQTEDAKKYQSELVQWRAAYHARFWNATSGTYTGNPLEVQTITATVRKNAFSLVVLFSVGGFVDGADFEVLQLPAVSMDAPPTAYSLGRNKLPPFMLTCTVPMTTHI